MPVKNAVAKAWSITPSGDGNRYSAWPAGDKPGFSPIIFYTDIIDGPTTGGENNKGCYLSVYGKNFGAFADWGVTSHLYIGGVEVDNYRYLTKAVDSGTTGGPGTGVWTDFGLYELAVQVGALGSPTAGTALNITMTVGGATLGNATSGGQFLDLINAIPLTFTPTQGTIVFVDPSTGNNANAGTFASPLQHLQSSTGSAGAMRKASASNATDGTPAGQHTYLMPGAHPVVGTSANLTGNYGCWAYLFRISGTQPASGLKKGNLVIKSYPPATGATAPTRASWTPANGSNSGGGIYGNDNARGANTGSPETNPYDGLAGWGRDIVVSNVKIICAGDAPRDGCPVNINSDGHRWRVVNNELSWPSTLGTSGGNNGAKGACVNGNGLNPYTVGNWMHDVSNGDNANQNHFVYIDGSNICANGWITCWNSMKGNTGGNGIQSFNSQASDFITNIIDHNNVIVNVNKHSLNISDNTRSRKSFNNLCIGAGEALVYFSSGTVNAANGLSVEHCTLIDWGQVVAGRGAFKNDGGTGTGSTNIRNCIVMRRSSGGGSGPFTTLDAAGTNNVAKCLWYDATGTLTTKPTEDATGSYANPLFSNLAGLDFSLQSGSPGVNASTTDLITRTYDMLGYVMQGTADIGAYEYGSHL